MWSSAALTKAWSATRPSAPGRFSTTTGLPQRAGSRSARSRAPISAPEPGPSGTMNFTGRCGQVCDWACACAANETGIAKSASTNARNVVMGGKLLLRLDAERLRDLGDLGALILD